MKTTVKIFSVVVLFLSLLSVKSFAQDGKSSLETKTTYRVEAMKKNLALTDDQAKSVYDLIISTTNTEMALWKSGKSAEAIEEEKDNIQAAFMTSMQGILTADQYTKFNTANSPEENAKWRAWSMKNDLGLSDDQEKQVYDLIISTNQKRSAISTTDKAEMYKERVKLNDAFYATMKTILTAEQLEKFNKSEE
jgi:hypothetical protein